MYPIYRKDLTGGGTTGAATDNEKVAVIATLLIESFSNYGCVAGSISSGSR